MIGVFVLASSVVLMTALLQVPGATAQHQQAEVDRIRSFYLAEAGLSEAYEGLRVGLRGQIGHSSDEAGARVHFDTHTNDRPQVVSWRLSQHPEEVHGARENPWVALGLTLRLDRRKERQDGQPHGRQGLRHESRCREGRQRR